MMQGLDPASRRTLWEVVKNNKRDRAIVLTTHSMEEAELLCDRLGIFVDGRLVCVGHPKDITSRHGSFLVRGHMFFLRCWLSMRCRTSTLHMAGCA
jgi:ABC-type multidrug transport system ATPase subunit